MSLLQRHCMKEATPITWKNTAQLSLHFVLHETCHLQANKNNCLCYQMFSNFQYGGVFVSSDLSFQMKIALAVLLLPSRETAPSLVLKNYTVKGSLSTHFACANPRLSHYA